jgi:hypothetical protein
LASALSLQQKPNTLASAQKISEKLMKSESKKRENIFMAVHRKTRFSMKIVFSTFGENKAAINPEF